MMAEMNEQTQEKIEKLKEMADESLEKAKDSICENCVWPFKESDQEAMTERCETCKVMDAINQAADKKYNTGHAIGLIEASIMLVNSVEKVHEEQFADMMARVHFEKETEE